MNSKKTIKIKPPVSVPCPYCEGRNAIDWYVDINALSEPCIHLVYACIYDDSYEDEWSYSTSFSCKELAPFDTLEDNLIDIIEDLEKDPIENVKAVVGDDSLNKALFAAEGKRQEAIDAVIAWSGN